MINIENLIKYEPKEVYSPSEDTYLLLNYFNKNLSVEGFDGIRLDRIQNILDMGTGTGIIAIFFKLLKRELSAFHPQIFASDIQPNAIKCAKRNEKRYDFKDPITFIKSDLFDAFPSKLKNQFDIIIFNPPYLPAFEPNQHFEGKEEDMCWDGGKEGYELFLEFLEGVRDYLRPNRRSRIYYITSSRVDLQTFRKRIARMGFKNKVLDKTHIFFEDIILSRIRPI